MTDDRLSDTEEGTLDKIFVYTSLHVEMSVTFQQNIKDTYIKDKRWAPIL